MEVRDAALANTEYDGRTTTKQHRQRRLSTSSTTSSTTTMGGILMPFNGKESSAQHGKESSGSTSLAALAQLAQLAQRPLPVARHGQAVRTTTEKTE